MEKLRPAWAVKAIIVIVFTSILFRGVCGTNHTVGGASGWDLKSNMEAWSSTTVFNVGDDLVFSYTPVYDVVEVNKLGYDTCTVTNALATYSTGDTVIHLTAPGTRYFVCGRLGHCQQGLKLQVEVLAPSNNNNGTGDDQDARAGAGGGGPPPPASPPQDNQNLPDDAPLPSHYSRAAERYGLLPLITLVIFLAFACSPFFFPFSLLSAFI